MHHSNCCVSRSPETIFPIKYDSQYPKKFREQICSTIYKRFFRIYAHIYHSHFKQIQSLGADAHLNTCFKYEPTDDRTRPERWDGGAWSNR